MEPQVFQTLCSMMYTVLHIFFLIVFVYLFINVSYLFIVSIAGIFYKKKSFQFSNEKKRIAVLITSYKEDRVILSTVKSAAEHNYPIDKFDVFVAADQLQSSTIAALKTL